MEIYKTPAVVHRGGVLDLVGHFIYWGWRERSLAHVGCPVGRVSVRSARGGEEGRELSGNLIVSLLIAFLGKVEPQVCTFSFR